MPVTTSIIHDTRYTSKNYPDKYPVKLRVYDGRTKKKRLYPLTYLNFRLYLTRDEWRTVHLQRIKEQRYKELRTFLDIEQKRAESCIMQLRPFTFAGFERLWKGEEVAGTLKELATEKKFTVNRHSSRVKYDQLLNKIAEFDSRELLPHDITFFWVQRFEKFLQSQKLSRARIIFYMRYLKAVLNYAVDKGVMDEKFIPFGRSGNKYTVGVPPKTIEKTLTKSEIRKLFAYEAEPGSEKHFALCIFRLSFYLSGANMADIFRLTKENIHGDRIVFIRRKTSDTSRTGRKVIANYTSVVQELFKALHKPGSHYLIPVLKEGMPEEWQMKKINHRTQVINRNLKEIAKELKLGKNITTGYARHSFATVLRDEGYTDDQIANLMGNSKSVVEKNYYGAADEEKINQIYNSLNLEEGGRVSDS